MKFIYGLQLQVSLDDDLRHSFGSVDHPYSILESSLRTVFGLPDLTVEHVFADAYKFNLITIVIHTQTQKNNHLISKLAQDGGRFRMITPLIVNGRDLSFVDHLFIGEFRDKEFRLIQTLIESSDYNQYY